MLVGLASHMIDRGVSILWYADGTILCIKYDYEMPRNLKLLYLYEMLLGLKINFVKSEVLMRNDNNNNLVKYANLFDCKIGTFPIKCSGES